MPNGARSSRLLSRPLEEPGVYRTTTIYVSWHRASGVVPSRHERPPPLCGFRGFSYTHLGSFRTPVSGYSYTPEREAGRSAGVR